MPADQGDPAVILAVVVSRVDDLREDIAALSAMLSQQRAELVPRGEWVMRNSAVDESFRSQGREIGDLRTELRSRRHPWPTVAAAIVAVAALGLQLVPALVA